MPTYWRKLLMSGTLKRFIQELQNLLLRCGAPQGSTIRARLSRSGWKRNPAAGLGRGIYYQHP
jgi:hypothetical protein